MKMILSLIAALSLSIPAFATAPTQLCGDVPVVSDAKAVPVNGVVIHWEDYGNYGGQVVLVSTDIKDGTGKTDIHILKVSKPEVKKAIISARQNKTDVLVCTQFGDAVSATTQD